MKTLNEKLALLQQKIIREDAEIVIMIIGLGSVGLYLLDYLLCFSDRRFHIVVAGRNNDKMQKDVNIVKTAATIRGQFNCKISIDATCNLDEHQTISETFIKWKPDFVVNCSRVYSGLKYGSISWDKLRAYGIWTPLSIRYARNIMYAYEEAGSTAITINTSYSDAVIPWLKSAGIPYFDFGSGNLNHLIPRMKFYIAGEFGIENLNAIDITLSTSHFHDVVVSKEGHDEGVYFPINVRYGNKEIDFNREDLLKSCKIEMPIDQKRNMMNASSNVYIIGAIISALENRSIVKFHSPGAAGEMGGYPFIINAKDQAKGYIDESIFSLREMHVANYNSIYLDGIKDIRAGILYYTTELQEKVAQVFGVKLPESIGFNEIDAFSEEFLISKIIDSQL